MGVAQQVRLSGLDLSAHIRQGDRVMIGQGMAEPVTLTRHLLRSAGSLPEHKVFVGPVYSDTFDGDIPENLTIESYGAIGRASKLARSGRLSIYPTHFSSLFDDITTRRLPVDCVLLQVRPSLSGRSFNLGIARDIAYAAARRARCVIAEINHALPACNGGDIDDDLPIAGLVEAEHPPLELASPAFDEIDRQVGRNVAALIPDGAVIQIGVGTVPNAVLSALIGHRDLGLHSGAVSDGVVDLVECGAMTNTRKEIDTGVGVAGILLGTRRLYDHAHRNPGFRLAGPEETHMLAYIARLQRFHAINSALAVDLTGQVSAESVDGRHVGAVGGQVDFVRAARQSPAGRAIIALPATTRSGASRIIDRVDAVTCARADADTIVTEYGVAELRGQNLAERAQRMIAIAAPQWREELSRAWFEETRGTV